MIKVSIIVPVYNTALYLKRCLDSLCDQTLKDIEIICIDDKSTDNSFSILQYYKQLHKDKLFTYVMSKNSGAALARNFGISKARGEYIGFCDSDDYVDVGYFEELYNYTLKYKYDIIRGIRVIDATNKHAKNPYGCIIPSLIRKEFLTEHQLSFPNTRSRGEDSRFKRWCFNNNPTVFECKDVGIYYHYMRREGSLSNYKL